MTDRERDRMKPVYLVPRSQAWEGSRGRAQGLVHLRYEGRFLCGRARGWYEREPDERELDERICPRCARKAAALAHDEMEER